MFVTYDMVYLISLSYFSVTSVLTSTKSYVSMYVYVLATALKLMDASEIFM